MSTRQSIRQIITSLFPWLTGIVTVQSAKGRGLAIRAAGALLHLAGGPDDPGVVRIGDTGSAGTLSLGDGLTSTLVYTPPDGTPVGILLTAGITPVVATIGANVPIAPITEITTVNNTGSEKVTCA
jgi:hypothetical protein